MSHEIKKCIRCNIEPYYIYQPLMFGLVSSFHCPKCSFNCFSKRGCANAKEDWNALMEINYFYKEYGAYNLLDIEKEKSGFLADSAFIKLNKNK